MNDPSGPWSLREWLPRLLAGRPHQVIGGPQDPYLLRWYVIPRNPLLNVYVHKFCRSDDDRALHDHPWWFASVMLKGGYVEISQQSGEKSQSTFRCAPEYRSLGLDRSIVLPRRMFAFRPATFRHRVALFAESEYSNREVPCWTLIATGRRVRTWGFWCRKQAEDAWDIATNEELDALARGETVLVDRFIPWTEFGDAGCGETA